MTIGADETSSGQVAEWDPKLRSYVVRRTDEWIVSVTPMIVNDRVILTHVDEYPWSYTAGWCYDKGGAAFLAARVYNPDTMREPISYKKVAGDSR
jgi:hypothetical protein